MPTLRASFASLVAVSLAAGMALAPFVALHEREAHGHTAHHDQPVHAASGIVPPPHHAHGAHAHPAFDLVDIRVQPRHESGDPVAATHGFLISFARVAPAVQSLIRLARPPRTPHPLSISGVLRI